MISMRKWSITQNDPRQVYSCFEMSLLLLVYVSDLHRRGVLGIYAFIVWLELVVGSWHLKFALQRPFRDKR
jgi:hypothetical protein